MYSVLFNVKLNLNSVNLVTQFRTNMHDQKNRSRLTDIIASKLKQLKSSKYNVFSSECELMSS